MAIKVSGTTVIDDSRNLQNTVNVNATGNAYANTFIGDGSQLTNLPAGGSSTDLVASGILSDGSAVIVNADGTVSVIAASAAASGTSAVFESASLVDVSIAYDSNAQKVVMFYNDAGNSYYGTAIVGTVDPSDNSISFGTAVVFESASTSPITSTFDSSNNKIVIAYGDGGNSNYGTAIVGTVSGTSISFGSATVYESANSPGPSITYDVNAGKVVIAYTDNGNSNYGTSIVGTVSGTSISFGTAVVFESASSEYAGIAYDSDSQKVVIAYKDGGNSNAGTAIVGTVSGTSISFGSAAVFDTANSLRHAVSYDSSAQKIVIAYRDSNDDEGMAVVGTVSGTSISFGTPAEFDAKSDYVNSVYDTAAQQVVIAYQDRADNYGKVVACTISGTSISFTTPFTFASTNVDADLGAAYDSNANRTVLGYRDGSNSDYGTAVVFKNNSTNLTSENFIGISNGAYANGATATVQLVGATDDAQSGLTTGSVHYVQADGRIASGVENEPYVIDGATYDSKVFNAGSQESAAEGLAFNADGTKMFTVGSGSDTVYEYDLATAFDISTAAYNSVSFSVASQETTPGGLDFSPDGTKMYIAGYTTDTVFQYTLSTGFDLSTASYASLSFDVSGQEDGLQTVVFNPDGSKMYIRGFTNNTFFQYSLSTPRNVSTASYDSVSFSPTAQGSQPISLVFNSDGTKCFVANGDSDAIFQYSLSSAYNVGTASYDSISLSIVSENNQPKDIAFSTDGTRLFLIGQAGGSYVYQYSTPALAYSTTVPAGLALSSTTLAIKAQ